MDGHPHRFATDFEQTLLGKASDTAGGWVPTSLPGHVNAFGEAGVPTPGLEGGVGCNSRVTFDGKVRNLGLCPQIRFPLPEDHRANILLGEYRFSSLVK